MEITKSFQSSFFVLFLLFVCVQKCEWRRSTQSHSQPFPPISQLDTFHVTEKYFNKINHNLILLFNLVSLVVYLDFKRRLCVVSVHNIHSFPPFLTPQSSSCMMCFFSSDFNKVLFIRHKLNKRKINPRWKFIAALKFYSVLSLR